MQANNFDSIKIGNQVWMQRNLNVDHYQNGDSIPEIQDSIDWANTKTGAWCYYNNDPVNGKIYGKLYNWNAVHDSRGLAPKGWHVSSDIEWKILTEFLGGDSVAGGKLKETSTRYWISPNTCATNICKFSALPCGWRNYTGSFGNVNITGCWMTSTEDGDFGVWGQGLNFSRCSINRHNYSKDDGYSVRCSKN